MKPGLGLKEGSSMILSAILPPPGPGPRPGEFLTE